MVIKKREPNPRIEGFAYLAIAIGIATTGFNLLGSLESPWPGGILIALAVVSVLGGLKKLGDANRADATKQAGDKQ